MSRLDAEDPEIRVRLTLEGVVQGVGFRPHVMATAQRCGVRGFVGNSDTSVFIEAQGHAQAVRRFEQEVVEQCPPLAKVISSTSRRMPLVQEEGAFRIVESTHTSGVRSLIPPDVAMCPDCRNELKNPSNRRYRYPFITCTQCGPRLSIIEDLPYDRPATTMRAFDMCERCTKEYQDVHDRRHHAQPISCFDCGPTLWLEGASGDPISQAREVLRKGQVLALKGIGGFHLMVRADDPQAVELLRQRKHRPHKPLALLARDIEMARTLIQCPDALLQQPAHPIVIAQKQQGAPVAENVAPGMQELGVMLPYSPLHELLINDPEDPLDFALVATSGNPSGEPIAIDNEQALKRLAGIADAFVLHDRGIAIPVEDSVIRYCTDGRVLPIRRSRGYAPLPIPLAFDAPSVLAIGAEMKNTAALTVGSFAHLSGHIGDMASLQTQVAASSAREQLLAIRRAEPKLVVADMHPGYASTAVAFEQAAALEQDADVLRVQHHHAHALSLLAEHSISSGPAAVLCIDGTGYGEDGTIFGCELLSFYEDLLQPERAWHLPTFPLLGGDHAIREPWRALIGVAHASKLPLGAVEDIAMWDAVSRNIERGVPTSSLGRLIDAAAAALWLYGDAALPGAQESSYEGQAACEFEALAAQAAAAQVQAEHPRRAFALLLEQAGLKPAAQVAREFLERIGLYFGQALLQQPGVLGVSGGCAVNQILVQAIRRPIEQAGRVLLEHEQVPANDGGLSLGQAYAGALYLRGF